MAMLEQRPVHADAGVLELLEHRFHTGAAQLRPALELLSLHRRH